MRGVFAGLLIVTAGLGTAGCGIATTAGADYAPGRDFSPYTSFAWDEMAGRRSGDVRLENNPFFEERLHAAVERELAARGIRLAQSAPGMRAHYHLSVEDHVEVFEANPEAGEPLNPAYGPGTDVLQYQQGTFIVHLVDASTGEDLWVGWAQGDIGEALESSEAMREWVDEAVARMFTRFPVAPTAR